MRLPAWRRPEWRFTAKYDLPLDSPGRELDTLRRLRELEHAGESTASDAVSVTDPLGFPWPSDSTTRTRAIRNFERDLVSPHSRSARLWLREISKDPWLHDARARRSLSRRGVPQSLRPYVWTVAIGSAKVFAQNYGSYTELIKAPVAEATTIQIDLDVPRTYPSHVWFKGDGRHSLRRVLHAFAAYNSYVNYCQSLNFLGGVLLLLLPEELAFWTLVQLIDRRLYGRGLTLCDYYSPDMFGLRRDMFVMGRLLEAKLPRVYAMFKRCGAEVEWLCSHWLLSLYTTRIPLLLSIRIWDSLILEGDKILFRVSLALVRNLGRRYRRAELGCWGSRPPCAADGILAVLRGNYELGSASVEDIMAQAFREHLSRAEIEELRARFLQEGSNVIE